MKKVIISLILIQLIVNTSSCAEIKNTKQLKAEQLVQEKLFETNLEENDLRKLFFICLIKEDGIFFEKHLGNSVIEDLSIYLEKHKDQYDSNNYILANKLFNQYKNLYDLVQSININTYKNNAGKFDLMKPIIISDKDYNELDDEIKLPLCIYNLIVKELKEK